MRRKPLGCLTGTALLFAAATVLLLVGAAWATGNGILAPGPLNAEAGPVAYGGVTSHAQLSGDCAACHTPVWSGETMADRCLGCHETVRDELASQTGLHGRFATAGECRTCHTDHGGAGAALTRTTLPDFPHDATGYSLRAHPVGDGLLNGGFACADCHTRSISAFDATTCATCHQLRDPAYLTEHVAAFGTDCRACHDGVDGYGAAFDHASWPLEGAHTAERCGACHAGSTDLPRLRSAPTTCVACHAEDDIHEGRLGRDCGSCHSAAGWDEADAGFDHARTAFALTGDHQQVECASCHVDRAWTGIGTTCEACHAADDPHRGQFTQSCAACHTTEGWDAVTFDHATTGFALRGAHDGPGCAACHAGGRYALTPTTCVGCHEDDDAHEDNLGAKCESCHRPTTWATTTFDHADAQFPLSGRHATIKCSMCHARLTEYRGTATTCYACHRADDVHERALGTDCSSCHGTRTWDGASFDHATTGFRLTGAHAGTTCAACHPNRQFAGTPQTCYGCHKADDRHDGAFGRSCGACHSTRTWSGARVDHDLTRFPLTGAHQDAPCRSCHKGGSYSAAPTACAACHDKPASHEPKPFTTCASCHSTRAWRPAGFDGPHTFPMSHRNADGVCSRCHPSTWASYSCARCHSNSKMNEHHKEVPGYSLTTCTVCHPRGQEDDERVTTGILWLDPPARIVRRFDSERPAAVSSLDRVVWERGRGGDRWDGFGPRWGVRAS